MAGGVLAIPSILSSCKKEYVFLDKGKNVIESKILALQKTTELESKFKQATSIYENAYGTWDCTVIRIVSHVKRTPSIKPLVTKKFGCSRTLDFLIEGSFLKVTACKVPLKFKKTQISGQSYYINIYDEPVAISLPVSGLKKLQKPFHYITSDMLNGSIIIQKV